MEGKDGKDGIVSGTVVGVCGTVSDFTSEHRKQAEAVIFVIKAMTKKGHIPDRHMMLYCQCKSVLELCDYIDKLNIPEQETKL